MQTKTIVILILLVLAVVIFFQNTQVVSFRLFFWTINMSRIILFVFAMIVGIIIGYLIGIRKSLKREGGKT